MRKLIDTTVLLILLLAPATLLVSVDKLMDKKEEPSPTSTVDSLSMNHIAHDTAIAKIEAIPANNNNPRP